MAKYASDCILGSMGTVVIWVDRDQMITVAHSDAFRRAPRYLILGGEVLPHEER